LEDAKLTDHLNEVIAGIFGAFFSGISVALVAKIAGSIPAFLIGIVGAAFSLSLILHGFHELLKERKFYAVA